MYETRCQSRFNARYWMLGASALGWPRGMVWGGRREEGSGWGAHVYLWWIHFDIWQNYYNYVKFKNKIKFKTKQNKTKQKRNPWASYDYHRWSKRYQGQEGCYKSIYWRSLEGTNGNAHWLQFVYILESFVTRTPFSVGRFEGSSIVKLSKEYIAFRIQKGTKTVRLVYL